MARDSLVVDILNWSIKMKNYFLMLAIVAAVSGCSTWDKLDRTERGAVIGTGAGAVTGGSTGSATGAIIGGAAGGVAGGVIGHETDDDDDDDRKRRRY
jgi:uncharacterized protein YcfJ